MRQRLLEGETLSSIAKSYNLTRERVRQVADPDGKIHKQVRERRLLARERSIEQAKRAAAEKKKQIKAEVKARRDRLIEMWNSGSTSSDIAKEFGWKNIFVVAAKVGSLRKEGYNLKRRHMS